jgi:hypothetical protein
MQGKQAAGEEGAAEKRLYKARRPRKPRPEGEAGDGAAPRAARRGKKESPNDKAIFGVHNALYTELQLQAELAKLIGKHMSNFSADLDKLGSVYADLGKYIIEELMALGMKLVKSGKPKALAEKTSGEAKLPV